MLNSSNENLEKKPTLQNNTVENTTFIELDDSYYDQANIYVQPNYAQWQDKKKNHSFGTPSKNEPSNEASKFKIFVPSGIEGLPKNSTPVAIFASAPESSQFSEALEDKKTLAIKKITISKKRCLVFELQLPNEDPRFLGFKTTPQTAINILAKEFKLTDIEEKKLESDILALSTTANISSCVPYVFLDVCLKHEDIAKKSLEKDVTYQALIKNSQKNQTKSK